VGLVDHQQAGAGQVGEGGAPEPLVGQPLGRDQQQVDLVIGQPRLDAGPLAAVLAGDRLDHQPHPLGSLDLVAHQGQQRRHQQGRPPALGPQEGGGQEVDGGLAPPGALDQQHPPPLDQGVDRLALARPQPGGGVAGQPDEQRFGIDGGRHGTRGYGWP
jgi:hypothetical protein